jgi:hypothetical protein
VSIVFWVRPECKHICASKYYGGLSTVVDFSGCCICTNRSPIIRVGCLVHDGVKK